MSSASAKRVLAVLDAMKLRELLQGLTAEEQVVALKVMAGCMLAGAFELEFDVGVAEALFNEVELLLEQKGATPQ